MAITPSIGDSERYLGKHEMRERYGLDPATLLRHVRSGAFPAPVYVFGRARWRLTEIQAWEAKNIGGSPPPGTANLRNQE